MIAQLGEPGTGSLPPGQITPVSPQLRPIDDKCIVSVLNRNAQAGLDGTWKITNVPSNQGRVRARAICVLNGLTSGGQSALFAVATNGTVNLQPIVFGPVSPIPSLLSLTSSVATLKTLGATAQIKTVATYPDGTTADVSSYASGTDYTSSNPAVATVSADGVVSAVSNGTVIITAYNEGTGGSTAVTIGIPPQIAIVTPLNGDTVTQGGTVPITTQIAGGATVTSVSFSVNGRIEFTTTTAPYIFNFPVPTNASSFTLSATVRDSSGASATSPVVIVMAVPDPLTTVNGLVVNQQEQPAAGATVNCLGVIGLSAADGTFSVPGVPTARGNVVCFASYFQGSQQLTGSSAAAAPVLGGQTNAGQIKLSSLSSRGTDFWLGYQAYGYGNGAQVFIMTETSAKYTLSGTGFSVSGTVTSSAPATVAVPTSFEITSNQAIENKALHLTSDAEITATFFYPAAATNDTYLAIPTALLGTDYLAATYSNGVPEIVVLGSQANTTVTITPTCSSLSGSAAGKALSFTFAQGQTYQYRCSSGDATGSQIKSDKPVAVIAGNQCANIPASAGYCDILSEMMLPTASLYGNDFYSAPFPGNGYDVLRVLAAQDGTTVTVDDGSSTPSTFVLNRGQFREFQTKRPSHYTSDRPVSLVQYATGITAAGVGDPLSMQLVPTSAFRSSSRFYSPSGFTQGNFAIIVAPSSAASSVAINGVAVTGFASLPGGAYQYVVTRVVTAQSVVTASQPVGVYAIGLTSAGSYGSPTTF